MKLLSLLSVILISFTTCSLPVAIFHGIGDSCSNGGMNNIANYFSNNLNGTYVKCIETGGSTNDFFTSFANQAKLGCDAIRSDKNFSGEFSVVGISQGALLARYIIQVCNMPGIVKRYVSIGGPQMGVSKFPHCDSGFLCSIVNSLLDNLVYLHIAQNSIGPAGYFRNNYDKSDYLNYSTFLADLNNEKDQKNINYKLRFLKLENVLLIKFADDTMIIPKETAHFGFLNEKDELQSLEKSEVYLTDLIGLRQLISEKKVKFLDLPGQHLNFGYRDIVNYMVPILK